MTGRFEKRQRKKKLFYSNFLNAAQFLLCKNLLNAKNLHPVDGVKEFFLEWIFSNEVKLIRAKGECLGIKNR